jgi:hypothetical protein
MMKPLINLNAKLLGSLEQYVIPPKSSGTAAKPVHEGIKRGRMRAGASLGLVWDSISPIHTGLELLMLKYMDMVLLRAQLRRSGISLLKQTLLRNTDSELLKALEEMGRVLLRALHHILLAVQKALLHHTG